MTPNDSFFRTTNEAEPTETQRRTLLPALAVNEISALELASNREFRT